MSRPTKAYEFNNDERESEVRIKTRGEDRPTARPPIVAAPFLSRVPVVTMGDTEMRAQPLDHRAGFLLSFVDGRETLETIVDASAMALDEVIAIVEDLRARGVITLW
jgi:hypothetical protein